MLSFCLVYGRFQCTAGTHIYICILATSSSSSVYILTVSRTSKLILPTTQFLSHFSLGNTEVSAGNASHCSCSGAYSVGIIQSASSSMIVQTWHPSIAKFRRSCGQTCLIRKIVLFVPGLISNACGAEPRYGRGLHNRNIVHEEGR
jgi:hypothetical protein